MPEKYTPPCAHYRRCGGCQLQNLPYGEQLLHKQRLLIRQLGELGRVEDIVGMEVPEHYRSKAHAAFGLDSRRKPVCGIYQSASHTIMPTGKCMLNDAVADRIISDIRGMLPDFKLQVYDERSGSGWLRHVLVRRGFTSAEVMVVLVAASPIFKLQKPFVRKLLELHPEIGTIILDVSDRPGPMTLGSREKVIYGSGYIEDTLCSRRFRISPKSLCRINPVQTEKLYSIAADMAAPRENETVLNAYCGIGLLSMALSDRAKQVIGVDTSRDAIGDAIASARLNGIKNCWFTASDPGVYLEQMAADAVRPDVVIMEPPRGGCDERFLSSLLKCSPSRIVYISGNAEALHRDLASMTRSGFTVMQMQPVDTSPYTNRVDCAVLLTGKRG